MSSVPPAAPSRGGSPVQPAYGPDLAAVLGPRLGWSRRRVALTAVGLLVALAAVAYGVRAALAKPTISHGSPPAFSFAYGGHLRPVAPDPGGLAKVAASADGRLLASFAVRAIRLPPYRGNVTALLVVWAAQRVADGYPGMRDVQVVDEGRARVGGKPNTLGGLPAYTVGFSARLADGHRVYGRDEFLLEPGRGSRLGIQVTMLKTPEARAHSADDVGAKDTLADALNSISVG